MSCSIKGGGTYLARWQMRKSCFGLKAEAPGVLVKNNQVNSGPFYLIPFTQKPSRIKMDKRMWRHQKVSDSNRFLGAEKGKKQKVNLGLLPAKRPLQYKCGYLIRQGGSWSVLHSPQEKQRPVETWVTMSWGVGSQPACCSHDAGSQQECRPRVQLDRRPKDSFLRKWKMPAKMSRCDVILQKETGWERGLAILYKRAPKMTGPSSRKVPAISCGCPLTWVHSECHILKTLSNTSKAIRKGTRKPIQCKEEEKSLYRKRIRSTEKWKYFKQEARGLNKRKSGF